MTNTENKYSHKDRNSFSSGNVTTTIIFSNKFSMFFTSYKLKKQKKCITFLENILKAKLLQENDRNKSFFNLWGVIFFKVKCLFPRYSIYKHRNILY